MARVQSAILILIVLTAACEANDLGTACPMEVPEIAENASANSVDFPSVVEVNTRFPCDSLTCVSTRGRDGYCSRECIGDSNCPAAFECLRVTELPPFEERSYCVWRACRVALECGDPETYDCIPGNYGPDAAPGLCGFREELDG